MKTPIIAVVATLILASLVPARALDIPQPKPASAEFERLKSLVGTWKGTTDMGQGPVEIVSQYRLIAAGTVLEEKVFAGTPQEMTTVFFDKGGKLALTHYCVLGNRPGMVLKSADERTLRFAFDPTCGIDPKKESHMHAMSLTFVDSETVTASCRAFIDGKEVPEHPTTMKRVKP